MSDDKQYFFVESPDGRKFKMVIRGDLGRLTVSKVRRYLGNYGIKDECDLIFNGRMLRNDMIGDDFGLVNNSVIHVRYEPDGGDADMSKEEEHANGQGDGLYGADTRRDRSRYGDDLRRCGAAPLQAQEAWSGDGASQETDALRQQLAALAAEKAELQQRVKALSKGAAASSSTAPAVEPFAMAQANLRVLGGDLGLPLAFDANCTCVLNGESRRRVGLSETDGLSLLISYDAQTQRVVLYTTLLTHLPLDNPPLLSKLYEILLEGSLLGREVCGGGVGISRDSGLVVLQTSFSAMHCDETLLRDTVPVFVEAVTRWRSLLNDLLE